MSARHSLYAAAQGLSMAFTLAAASVPFPAHAELGGSVASAEADAVRLRAMSRFSTAPTHSLHEIEAGTGHVIREYAAADGQIFAVSWEGPTIPDLRQLLGEKYFAVFQKAAQQPSQRRGPVLIETPDFVFQQTGRLRDFRGRAYLPHALPAGFSMELIR